MKQKWQSSGMTIIPVDRDQSDQIGQLSDAEIKIKLEQAGYKFQKKYQASKDYIYRNVAGADVLISVGDNIANFNGYIEINKSAADLWQKLQASCSLGELERVLEQKYGITHEHAVEDVLDFLKILQEHDMVVIQ